MKPTLQKAFNDQLSQELSASHTYLSMAAYFESKSLKGFSSWMKKQAEEERLHAMKFFDHLHERGAKVTLGNIPKPKTTWKNPLDAFEASLQHEKKVTSLIHSLAKLSEKEKDLAARQFLDWFISEQVEEEDQAQEIIDKLKLIKNDPTGLLFLDKELANRGA